MFLYYVSYFGQTVNTGRETVRIFCENTAEDLEGAWHLSQTPAATS